MFPQRLTFTTALFLLNLAAACGTEGPDQLGAASEYRDTSLSVDSLVESPPQVPTAQASSTITVYNRQGEPYALSLREGAPVVLMATWCPYSKQLIKILHDSVIEPRVAGRGLVFLFERDEWETVERHLEVEADDSTYTRADVPELLEALKKRVQWASWLDPTMLEDVPGEVYFYDSSADIQASGTPSAFSKFPAVFTKYAATLLRDLGIPEHDVEAVFDRYQGTE